MKRNEIRPFEGKRRARAPTLNLTSLSGATVCVCVRIRNTTKKGPCIVV